MAGQAVGAAIGTAILPGVGTMVGRALGGFVGSKLGGAAEQSVKNGFHSNGSPSGAPNSPLNADQFG
jgi:phage tail tape-measure protein